MKKVPDQKWVGRSTLYKMARANEIKLMVPRNVRGRTTATL